MFELKGKVLEFTKGTFEGNDWAHIKVRSNDIADNKILVYSVDVKKAGDVSGFLDKDVIVKLILAKGASDKAVLKVVQLSESEPK